MALGIGFLDPVVQISSRSQGLEDQGHLDQIILGFMSSKVHLKWKRDVSPSTSGPKPLMGPSGVAQSIGEGTKMSVYEPFGGHGPSGQSGGPRMTPPS